MSAAEAGGEAARIVFDTVKVSSFTSGRPASLRLSAFNLQRTSMPPRDVNKIFHKSSKTFFMGKWGAAPEQKRVTIDINLMANNSSPSTGVSEKKIKTFLYLKFLFVQNVQGKTR